MKTEKLYYENAYLTECQAKILEYERYADNEWAIILDRTVFYPEGGGQPCDFGLIDNIPVHKVMEKGGRIVHITNDLPLQEHVNVKINWDRRFDHMQQHGGEHILSWAFVNVMQANNIGFHLNNNITYIDLDVDAVSDQQIKNVEAVANKIVFSNLPVASKFVVQDQLPKFSLRKQPAKEYDQIRIVEIQHSDCCPCGGTHVNSTGEIGLIKICSHERKNKAIRVYFVCGGRALTDYQQKNTTVNFLSRELTVPVADISAAYCRQTQRWDEMSRQIAELRQEIHTYMGRELVNQAEYIKDTVLISKVFTNMIPKDAADLAKLLVTKSNMIVLLGCINNQQHNANLIFACSEDITADMNGQLKQILPMIGGKGGGTSHYAQGGTADSSNIIAAIDQAKDNIKSIL